MRRISTLALLAVRLTAAPAAAQQLLAWPLQMAPQWRPFLPGQPPVPRPMPNPFPRPLPMPSPMPSPLPALPPDAAPVTMSGYRVEGNISDQVAELTYRITFHNPTDRRLEGVLMVPIPADTQLSGFAMNIGGKETKGELLEATQAASIYEGIVRRAMDPGLLELVGERMFRARVFPIEPRGDVAATLKLTQTLPQSGGLISLRVPMRSARFASGGTDGRASARIALHATRSIRSLFAPNPEVRVERSGDHDATIVYEEGSSGPQDLAVMYSLKADPLAAGVLAYRAEGEDGTFLLTLSPKFEADVTPAPKDVVFVLDRSGSMADDGKMDQAKKALQYCVAHLSAADRFGIVDFATDVNQLEERLLPADAADKARAKRYIEGIEPAGGTNIEAGLGEGLKLLGRSDGRVPMIFFLTDGVPTVGQTDVSQLLRQVSAGNSNVRALLFNFGVGSDVNTLLLDKLADEGRGARDYVAPGEDIEAKLSALYQKVSKPALTDVHVEWRGLDAVEVFPRPVPDLFHGSELSLYGRYKTSGKGTLVVTGKSGGREVRFEYPVELPAAESRNAFLPRLWAGQKVAHELDALRMSGGTPSAESIASIVKLAKKYGIVTPYTSFLVTEEGANGRVAQEMGRRRFEALALDAASSGFAGGGGTALRAQADSIGLKKMKASMSSVRGAGMQMSAAAAPAAALNEFEAQERADMKARGRESVETRTVGDKTFYKRDGVWTDADAEEAGMSARKATVTARSPEYFALAAKSPMLARCLALGDKVTVLWGGTVYSVVSE